MTKLLRVSAITALVSIAILLPGLFYPEPYIRLAHAVDTALSGLTAATVITDDDLFLVSDSPASSPVSKKATANLVRSYATNGAFVTGTDANTTMAVNTTYLVNMSAWATADRTYTLPTACTVGDRIKVIVTAGNATTFELLLTAAPSDTLNAIAGGTEWSRLFITGEMATMLCTTVDSAWVVERDGRISQKCQMQISTAASGESAATAVRPTLASGPGAWTAITNIGSICSTSGDSISTRRVGSFALNVHGSTATTLGDAKYFGININKNVGATLIFSPLAQSSGTASGTRLSGTIGAMSLVVDDYLVFSYRTEEGTKGLAGGAGSFQSSFSLAELLP